MFKLFGFVIQKEIEYRTRLLDLYAEIDRLNEVITQYSRYHSSREAHITDLETIIKRYKEKMRERNKEELDEQTKS